jgi:hypothetical protein
MRLAVVLAALAATAGMAYRAFHDELALRANTAATRQAIDLADRALTTSADLRAALHAYVAPGQGSPFWVSRSAVLLEELQSGLTSLAAMDPEAVPIAAEPITKLLAAEKRARGFLRDNQELLASDVIFTECRDQLDAIRLQIAAARDRDLAAADGREAGLRREQYLLLAAILGVWMLCALLLMPVPEAPTLAAAPKVTSTGTDDMLLAPFDYAQGSREHGRGTPPAPVVVPEPVAPQPVLVKAPPPFDFAQGSPEHGRGAPPVPRLPEAAQVCADMARVSDGEQIASLLARAADILDATGLIVWVTSADGTSLVPAAHCGYDERLLAHVGALPLDSENLTAAAFRDGARRTTSARSGAPAAIAAPLVGPSGTIGVLSGEVRHVERVGETTSALASIFAAQLATLVGSMPPVESAEPPAEQITK